MEFCGDVRVEACLNGFKRGPVDETIMMLGQKHRPLVLRQMTNAASDSPLLIDIALVAGLPIDVGASIHRIAEHVIDGDVGRRDPTELMAREERGHEAHRMHREGQPFRAEPQPDLTRRP
jgi:hypothetical protein